MPNLKHKRGQGLVEYIILITMMGVALIFTLRSLGRDTRDKFNEAAQEIRGL